MKTVMLMALVRPCRSADLASLDLQSIRMKPEGVSISCHGLAKQARPGKQLKDFFFPSFAQEPALCPVQALKKYCQRTKSIRQGTTGSVFIATTKPHKPVSSATIARWIKSTLSQAKIDTSIFKAHSVRCASTSAAAAEGISVPEILEAADWSSQTIFEKYYYRPGKKTAYGTAVLQA